MQDGVLRNGVENSGRGAKSVQWTFFAWGNPSEGFPRLQGADPADAEILMLDETYWYSPTGKAIENGTLELPPYSCVEIRFQ